MRRLEFEIPHASPSPNKWVWKSWHVYAAIKKRWLKRVYDATIQKWPKNKFGKPMARAELCIVRFGSRQLDDDNLRGGMKPIIDSLIGLGYLLDDNPNVLVKSPDVSQQKSKRVDERTYIRLTEIT